MFLKDPISEQELKDKIEAFTQKRLKLKINQNKSRYLSFSKRYKQIDLSIHQMFLLASDEIIEMLCRFLCSPKKEKTANIRKFVHFYDLKYGRLQDSKPKDLNTKGVFFDLKEIYQKINRQFFSERMDLSITWFKKPMYRKARSITFGSYDPGSKIIRINQLLDDAKIALYFIEFIVFHEMLHHEVEPKIDSMGRKWVHTSEFRKREKSFPRYKQAKQFGKNFLMRLANGRA